MIESILGLVLVHSMQNIHEMIPHQSLECNTTWAQRVLLSKNTLVHRLHSQAHLRIPTSLPSNIRIPVPQVVNSVLSILLSQHHSSVQNEHHNSHDLPFYTPSACAIERESCGRDLPSRNHVSICSK